MKTVALSCPFCDEIPKVYKTNFQPGKVFGTMWHIGCKNLDCGIRPQINFFGKKVDGIEKWNVRNNKTKTI